MTTQEIAARLVQLCRLADFSAAQKELFADNAVSIEPHSTADFQKETYGLDNILEKGKKFSSMIETLHSISISDPVCASNSIAVALSMDVTMKERGRMKMSELCVYTTKDGKIVSEQFFM